METNIKPENYEIKVMSEATATKKETSTAGKFTSRSGVSISTKFSQLSKDSIQPWLTLNYDREVNKFLPETGLGIPAPPVKPMFKTYIATIVCFIMVFLMIMIPVLLSSAIDKFETKFWLIVIFELMVVAISVSIMASVYNKWKQKRDLWE